MLKAAMVGAWHVHFDQYATEFSAREDCQITALWDDDLQRGAAAAAKYGCDFESDYAALLRREDVEAVLVCSSTNLHPSLLIQAAQAGKHIFTEKGLAFTMADAEKIRQAVVDNGVQFAISFVWKPRPDIQLIKQIVDDGRLGPISYARMRNVHNGAVAGWLPEYFYDPVLCGGGAMMDLGAHSMYLLNWLLGRPQAVSSIFTAVTGKAVEDNAVSVLEYANGAIALSETGFVSGQTPWSLEIGGTKGSLFAGGPTGQVYLCLDGKNEVQELPPAGKTPLNSWVDAILYGGENPYTIDDAVELTRLMEAAYRSHREGRKVTL